MPGVCSYGFFFFFSNSKKKHIITEKTEHKIVGSPVNFPLPSPQPQRGGEGSWMSDWHVYPRTPPLFCIHLFAPPPGRGVRFFTPLTMGVSPAWHPIKKKMVWNLFKRWRWDRRFGLRIKFKHRSFRSEPHRFFSVGGASYLLAKAWVTGKNQYGFER